MFFHDVTRISNGFPMLFHDFADDLLIYNWDVRRDKTKRLGWCRGSRLRKKTVCRKPWRQKVLNDFHKIGDLTKQTWGCNGINIGIHRIDIWIFGSENIQIYLWSLLTMVFLGIRFSENPYLSIYIHNYVYIYGAWKVNVPHTGHPMAVDLEQISTRSIGQAELQWSKLLVDQPKRSVPYGKKHA